MDLARPMTDARISMQAPIRTAGVLFFVLAAQFMTVMMIGASIAPGYDMSAGAISDLGVVDETAPLFNASLIAVGVLNVVGGALYFRAHGSAGILGLFVVAAAGAAGAGLFPLDSGGPHGLFALLAFVAFNLEAIAVGTLVTGPMKLVSILAGVVGLVFVVLMAIGDAGNTAAFGPIGHGATERLIVYPAMLWVLALGGYLMASGESIDTTVGRP